MSYIWAAADGVTMKAQITSTAWKRVAGRFRRMAETELGQEQLCMSCQELWPLDHEFFLVSHNTIGYECKACIQEGRRRRPAIKASR